MIPALRIILISVFCLSLIGPALAGEKGNREAGGAKDLAAMSQQDLIKLALSAAPAHISKDAAVMLPAKEGWWKRKKAATDLPAFPPSTTGPCRTPCALTRRWASGWMRW